MKTKKIAIGKLRMDVKLLEMRKINDVFVSRYRQAYRMGADMPRMIVEEKTNFVVSGNHRLTALLKEFPRKHKVEVIIKRYANRREMLEEFVRENASHGNAIDRITRKKLCAALIEEGATPEDLSRLFHVSIIRIEKLGEGKVLVTGRKGKTEQFVKAHFKPKDGKCSEKEYAEHIQKDRGIPITVQVSQLIRWLRQGSIELSQNNLDILSELEQALSDFFDGIRKKKAS